MQWPIDIACILWKRWLGNQRPSAAVIWMSLIKVDLVAMFRLLRRSDQTLGIVYSSMSPSGRLA